MKRLLPVCLGIAVIAAILALTGIFTPRPAEPVSSSAPAPEPMPEVPRDQLQRVDGRWWRSGAARPLDGVMVERYADGSMRTRSEVRDGLLDGISEGWTPAGQLEVRESFRRGVSHGLRTRWYASGVKRSEAMIVDGQIDGAFVSFHENGALAESVSMKDGVPHGVSRAFHPDGRLKAEVELDHGRVVAPVPAAVSIPGSTQPAQGSS